MKRKASYVPSKTLKETGEFSLIKKLQRKCCTLNSGVLIGIGDDAAVLKPQKTYTLITSDMMIEDIHFDLSFTTFFQLGYKFLAVNISDIFAMGGTPAQFVVSMGIPADLTVKNIEELYSGILKLADKYKISLIGGDTCRSEKGLILSGTLTGTVQRPVTRSGAREGDAIYVTDTLGDSAMGLHLLRKNRKKLSTFPAASVSSRLMKKHLMPDPMPIKTTAKFTSMIDVSDGLLIDLCHICDDSKSGATIYSSAIPISEELKKAAKKEGLDPLSMALQGGEDYVLLFTAPPDVRNRAYRIGEITSKGRYIIDSSGEKRAFKPEGYDHFK